MVLSDLKGSDLTNCRAEGAEAQKGHRATGNIVFGGQWCQRLPLGHTAQCGDCVRENESLCRKTAAFTLES